MYSSNYKDEKLPLDDDTVCLTMSFINERENEDKTKVIFGKKKFIYYRNTFGTHLLDIYEKNRIVLDTMIFSKGQDLNKIHKVDISYCWNREVPQIYVLFIGTKKFFEENKEKIIPRMKSILIEDIIKERKKLQNIESNISNAKIEE